MFEKIWCAGTVYRNGYINLCRPQIVVRMSGVDSGWHPQEFGIVQGCPLSLFLFSIVMTCLISDANRKIEKQFGLIAAKVSITRFLLYADDILIMESNGEVVREFMEEIERQGKRYGLEFNHSKLEMLSIDCEEELLDGRGAPIKKKDRLVYLGSLLCGDGRAHAEVSRCIGAVFWGF